MAPTMKNFKLTLAYDGTRFSGWQKQGNTVNTIQAVIEAALAEAVGEKAELIGAGRTDAGVHANGQVANCKFYTEIDAAALMAALNAKLPSDIAVLAAAECPERFHARYNARGKTYRYRIWNHPVLNPFQRKHSLWVPEPLDCGRMREAAEMLVGRNDFKAFSTGKTKKSTIRTLHEASVETVEGMTICTFRGDGFLYNMVRIMTGTIIECGRRQREPVDIPSVFEKADRNLAGYTAPAHGLFLDDVWY